jgi:hypothetical protein
MSKRPVKHSIEVNRSEDTLVDGPGGDVPQLETHHLQWIFDAAIKHFAERIRDCENDLVRHQAFLNEPACEGYVTKKTRQELISHSKEYLMQYRTVHAFCVKARDRVVELSAKEFAESVGEWLRGR